MKSPFARRHGLWAVALLALTIAQVRAQVSADTTDLTPPVVAAPIKDITVAPNSAPTTLDLTGVFGLDGVKGQLARMNTNLGKIDLELYGDAAPNTVANFLRYVAAGSYTGTIFHKVKRNASGTNVTVLGGAFALTGSQIGFITTFGNVDNEYSLPDTRGTIAMYKQHDSPDSASDQWFFNVTDNSAKYGSGNDGGYTVFGRVIGNGMKRVDAIAALGRYDISGLVYIGAFKKTPLQNYDPSRTLAVDNLVLATSVVPLSLVAQGNGNPGELKITVASNTNPDLVNAAVSGGSLILRYTAGQLGTAAITLQAKDQAKTKVLTTFNVTVQ